MSRGQNRHEPIFIYLNQTTFLGKGSHHGRKAAFLWSFAGRGGGSDKFRTFWGDFGMCVEITNRL